MSCGSRASSRSIATGRSRGRPASAPLLIVYALVNRPYMMDLQEDRSLIRGLLAEGLDVYLIDWGYPDGADRFTTLADYIDDLSRRLRRADLRGAPAGCSQHARRVPGRSVQPVLCGAASAARAQSHHDGHAGRFPHAGGPAVEVGQQDRRRRLGRRGQRLGRCAESAVPVADAVPADAAEVRRSPGGKSRPRRGSKTSCESSTGSSTARIRPAPRSASSCTWFYQENRLAQNRLEIAGRKVDLRASARCRS